MSKGTVKFFNDSKGFGEFDLQEGRKGLNAVNVKVI